MGVWGVRDAADVEDVTVEGLLRRGGCSLNASINFWTKKLRPGRKGIRTIKQKRLVALMVNF